MNGIYQYESYLKEIFKKLDTNGDGKISKKELEEFFAKETPFLMNQSVAESMAEVDLNGDGFIDMEELIQHMRSKRSKTLGGK
jgi:calcium-binding protein CML